MCRGQFLCHQSRLCVPRGVVCDGHANCPNGEDEQLCAPSCPDGCNCFDRVVNCTGAGAFGLPSDIHANTTVLDLSHQRFLSNNKLKNFLQKFPYLFHLNLRGNHMNDMPRNTFEKSGNLRSLDLSNTGIKKLRNNYFDRLYHLRSLKLQENKFRRIQPKFLSKLKKLEVLDLRNTSLSLLKDDLFENSFRLKELYLSDNNISKIGAHTFAMLTELEVLDLSGNEIREIARHSLHFLRSLKTLLMPAAHLCCLTEMVQARNECQVN